MTGETTRRTVRIEDGLWDEAKAAASERGENLSEVIRDSLWHYVNNHVNQKERNADQ